MAKIIIAALVAAVLAAVVHADYVISTSYSDSSCATPSTMSMFINGCVAQSSLGPFMKVDCSGPVVNTYASATCTGTVITTVSLKTYFGAGTQDVNTCAANSFGGGSTKFSCSAGTASISALPPGLVEGTYSSSTCTANTLTSAYNNYGCTASNGGGVTKGCSATEWYYVSYQSSPTCSSGNSANGGNQPLKACTANSYGAYTMQSCNIAAKSGAATVVAGAVAAVAAAAAVVALA